MLGVLKLEGKLDYVHGLSPRADLSIYIANISYTKCMHINLMLDTFLKEATLRASILPTLRW